MEKLLIALRVPALGETYDLSVPDFLPVGQLISMLAQALADLSGGEYISSGQALLCRAEARGILNPGHTLGEYRIQNGEELLLL